MTRRGGQSRRGCVWEARERAPNMVCQLPVLSYAKKIVGCETDVMRVCHLVVSVFVHAYLRIFDLSHTDNDAFWTEVRGCFLFYHMCTNNLQWHVHATSRVYEGGVLFATTILHPRNRADAVVLRAACSPPPPPSKSSVRARFRRQCVVCHLRRRRRLPSKSSVREGGGKHVCSISRVEGDDDDKDEDDAGLDNCKQESKAPAKKAHKHRPLPFPHWLLRAPESKYCHYECQDCGLPSCKGWNTKRTLKLCYEGWL
jgi:hypothetical protein